MNWPPNFVLLDTALPDVASLVTAMLQARDAVKRRSWSHPQEPTGEEWWADVLADPRARKRERRTDLAVKCTFYRLADEKREIILVACTRCEWRAAFARDELIASHGADQPMPNLLDRLAAPDCPWLGSHWDAAGRTMSSRLTGAKTPPPQCRAATTVPASILDTKKNRSPASAVYVGDTKIGANDAPENVPKCR
jgi:hypothetical protein